MKSAAGLGAVGTLPLMAAAAEGGPRTKAPGGIRVGNLYFSSGMTGVRDEARKDPLAFGGDIKEQTEKNAMNEVYGRYFPKDAPSRSAFGVEFPDTATRVEIELVAYIPS